MLGLLFVIVCASQDDDAQGEGAGLIEFLVRLVEKQNEKINEVVDALEDAKEDIEELKLKLKLKASKKALIRPKKDIRKLKKKLSSVDHKTSTNISVLTGQQAEITNALEAVDEKVGENYQKHFIATQNLVTRMKAVEDIAGNWPQGSYCILASGTCPKGFTKYSAHLRAVKFYIGQRRSFYIKEQKFGDSIFKCHRCKRGDSLAEIDIISCCK